MEKYLLSEINKLFLGKDINNLGNLFLKDAEGYVLMYYQSKNKTIYINSDIWKQMDTLDYPSKQELVKKVLLETFNWFVETVEWKGMMNKNLNNRINWKRSY